MNGLYAVLLCVGLALPVAAQPPSPSAAASGVAAARALVAGGRYDDALAAIASLPVTGETLRVQLDAQLGLKQFNKALDTYDAIGDAEHKPSNELLVHIAQAVVADVAQRPDPVAALEACKALLAIGADPCGKRLADQAALATTPLSLRLVTLAALVSAGQPGARAQFQQLAQQAKGRDQRGVVEAARELPAADVAAAVTPALSNPEPDIQFAAALVLGDKPSPESRKALADYLAGTPHRMARGAAVMSLAILGDDESLKQVTPGLAEMQGGDLLKLGEALAAKNDPRGAEALERAARDDRDLIRVAAAAQLATSKPQIATPIFKAAMSDINPFMRAAALKEFRTTPLVTVGAARGFMLDSDPTVRVRACEALFTRLGPTKAAAAGKAPIR